VYDRLANGDVAPVRTVIGPSTGLSFPFGLAHDAVNAELIASNIDDYAMRIYSAVAHGDIAALRTLDGPNTGLNYPSDVAVLVSLDGDGDGVPDDDDNCPDAANDDQRDTNGDGIGNICDADLNNDGVVDFQDLGLMKGLFFSQDPDADLDGDGFVNFPDLAIMKASFFQPPG
jgi:hypothetical protein